MQVFDIGADIYLDAPFPMALIVGEGCEEGIRTLLLGTESHKTIEETAGFSKSSAIAGYTLRRSCNVMKGRFKPHSYLKGRASAC
ncbi:Uncharacterised protein [Paenibacillus macerans]|uniref:Uncharacterized protein n=1 Tax=Paenibacillus macerans TaxID=44252 RepID=A0A090ZID0_PAEMA|nr:hypothetical protein DJ90_890 [Paenibacillus macerans]GIP11972.1 hypothetical protein J1TS5_41420 [Paenibacillus macerans]SUD26306.1 Uncharacterised protein [Paenibacillus macerans]